jgi:AraC family transcriptional activator of pobA
MIPQLTTLSNFKDCIAYMDLPVYKYLDNDDFGILKVHEMGISLPFQSPTFRPLFYTFSIVTQGIGTYIIGNETFELRPNHIIITRPDAFFASSWTQIDKVYNITFNKNFLSEYLPEGIDEIFELGAKNGYSCSLSQETMDYFEKTCIEIYNTAISSLSCKDEFMANLIINLLFFLQLEKNDTEKLKIQSEKYSPIVTAFRQNMENNFNNLVSGKNVTLMRTKEHANLLNINENYLSKVVSSCTKKTVNEWINQKLIDEIKYLLKHSDKSMKEIAKMFGFKNLNYFYSYFKTHTQNAPGSIRKEYNSYSQ